MNWIEILRLIVQIWPLIEQILRMITNAEQREAIADDVRVVAVKLVNGTMLANTPNDVIAALAEPLKMVA